MLIAGNLTACANRIALLVANRRQVFAAFGADAPLFSGANNVLFLAHVSSRRTSV